MARTEKNETKGGGAREPRAREERRGKGIKLPGLRSAREAKGLSMKGLEAASGVSRSTIYRVEAGESGARSRTIRQLAKALEVDVEYLTGGEKLPHERGGVLASSPPKGTLVGESPREDEPGEAWRMAFLDAEAKLEKEDAAEDRGEEGDIEALVRDRARREGVSTNEVLRMMFHEYAVISRHAPLPIRSLPTHTSGPGHASP